MKIDLSKVNRAIEGAFKATANKYAENCTEAIDAEIWRWDGITLRKSGEVATSPRTIRDTDELRDSQEVNFPDANTAIVEYTAEHAANVHEGIDSNGNPTPARPWLEHAAANTDFQGIMTTELRKRLKS